LGFDYETPSSAWLKNYPYHLQAIGEVFEFRMIDSNRKALACHSELRVAASETQAVKKTNLWASATSSKLWIYAIG
jgi:hypothetical protein